MHIVFSPRAVRDLEEIGDYIAEDSPRRAISFVCELREHCRSIASAPKACSLREDLAPGIRMAVHGRYVIFYRELDADLRIERILHGARDLQSIFEDE
ncbi:MAG TPA: type II toxin-antitoxin system RelE/ParE family toxin [Methylococcaceae bacterium]|jgi:toxin ParE1/3/4|nr:type II toxin-antitoxin system RelE/ParE family toxin [Methylococcaceae bacterium]